MVIAPLKCAVCVFHRCPPAPLSRVSLMDTHRWNVKFPILASAVIRETGLCGRALDSWATGPSLQDLPGVSLSQLLQRTLFSCWAVSCLLVLSTSLVSCWNDFLEPRSPPVTHGLCHDT